MMPPAFSLPSVVQGFGFIALAAAKVPADMAHEEMLLMPCVSAPPTSTMMRISNRTGATEHGSINQFIARHHEQGLQDQMFQTAIGKIDA
jgi:hypothetical protein